MPGPTEITATQLNRLIGTPCAPTIIDICLDEDHALDPRLIPGARRWPHDRIEELAPDLTRAVIVCQKGKKLSQGAAALLRTHGVAAETLEGGMVGWAEAGFPAIPADAVDGSLWVTRQRPKIDRIACPWLIRRFVDPNAGFLFVAPAEVMAVADRFGATPFDVGGGPFSHIGDRCAFDAMLDHFSLRTPALSRLASIVRAADTGRLDEAPQAAGLLAASLGFSRMHRDDLAQLDAAMPLYDALYRWARDASEEAHHHSGASE
ncbi:MAG: sulfurtransferase/chromate resistance protein [Pseudomonadota bacterium]